MLPTRKKLVFKVNGDVVVEKMMDLFLNQIDEVKSFIAQDLNCQYDDVEVDTIDEPVEMSDEMDVSYEGLIFWRDTYFMPVVGVICTLKEGSDEWFDARANGTIEKYLHFVR